MKKIQIVSHCATYMLKQNDTYCNIGCKIKIKLPTRSHVNPGVQRICIIYYMIYTSDLRKDKMYNDL